MPIVNLTAAYIDRLKKAPPPSGRLEVWDEKTPGLCLRVSPSGSGSWTFRYRPRDGAGYQRVTLGSWTSLTLADARERAARHRVAIVDGGDPQGERKAKRAAAANVLTFARLAERYLAEYAKPRKSSWQNDERYLKRARAAWGDREAAGITRRDAIDLLDEIKAGGAPTSANRCHSVLTTLFNWAVEDELLVANPIAGLRKRAVEHSKDRVLADAEIRILWRAIDAAAASPGIVAALRVLMLTGQRPGEVSGMRRAELVDIDKPGAARWEIPAARTKARRAHIVPIAEMARAILIDQLARKGANGDGVFVSRFAERDQIVRHSLSRALRRTILGLDAASMHPGDEEAVAGLRANPASPHDMRRTVATALARLGVERETRLAVLAHSLGDVHHRHYDKYLRMSERRCALELWEAHIRAVLGEPDDRPTADNIVPIRGAR